MKQASSHLLIILAIVLISFFIMEKGGVVSSFQDNVIAVIVNQRVGERRSVFSPSDIYKRLNENEKWLMGAILAQSEGQQELANYYFQLTADN
ncbi:MAG: hypothetical protein KDE51_28400, partial [Anaerolineales bacterium]|nr:hypothetical protein [Anaerolineales bacterium]